MFDSFEQESYDPWAQASSKAGEIQTLTEQQVALLRWVKDGCPDGVMSDLYHRISIAALQKRGLVEVNGKGASWSAELAQAGEDYLRQVDGPNPPIPRSANDSVSEQLIENVIDAGGTLEIPAYHHYEEGSVDYERRARLAMDHGKVPHGKWLICVDTGDAKELRLIDSTVPIRLEATNLVPVEVPEKVSRYHSAIRRFRDAKPRHEVSRIRMPRALKIAQAIAIEAERRSWTVELPPHAEGDLRERGWSARKDGHLLLLVGENEYAVRLYEERVYLRGPWDEEMKRYRDSVYWYGDPPKGSYDTNGSGSLEIELIDKNRWSNGSRQSKWGDRKSWKLESRLPYLFREIERRLVDAERMAEESRINAEEKAKRERQAAEVRRMRWEQHVQRAKQRLLEHHRKEVLFAQASKWREVDALRAYQAEMESVFGQNPDTRKWIDWIDEHITTLDPLSVPPSLPEAPETSVDTLQPFMPEGWSAQDPELVFDQRHGHRRPHRSSW